MVSVVDVGKAVETRLSALPAFAAAVPGGAYLDRGPDEPTAYPYEVHKVERSGDAEVTSGAAYVQAFRVTLVAYCPVPAADAVAPAAVGAALFAATCSADGQAALKATPLRNPGERVLHCRPLAPSGRFDQSLRQGKDVFVCGLEVEILVQGDRGNP